MFLNDLTDAEKKAFLALSEKLIEADGVVTDKETTALKFVADGIGLSLADTKISVDESYKILAGASEQKKRAFYVEILSIALTAENYGNDERDCMKEYQTHFGLTDAFVQEAEEWLRAYLDITQRGYQLMGC